MNFDENFQMLEDLLELKRKYKDSPVLAAINVELFPKFDDKISKRVIEKMEKRILNL